MQAYVVAVEDGRDPADLRAEVEGDVCGAGALRNAIDVAKGRIRHWQEQVRTGTSLTKKAEARDMVGRWQQELQATEQLDQQAAVHAEQQCVVGPWTVSYVKFDGGDVFKYTHQDGREQSTRPPHDPEARYTDAVEDQRATLEREYELDAARGALSVRACLGLAIDHRENSLSWETELVHLYHMTVDAQGTDYTTESAQLVAAARRTLGLDAAIEECHERPHCCEPEWIGERYLALLLKHRGGQLVEAARGTLTYRVALGIAAMDDHLGMERALGQDAWRAEEDLLRRVVDDKRPDSRRRLSRGSGALPFDVATGRALTKLAATMRPLPAMTQIPDARGYVPFRTDRVVMTPVAKGECVLEAVRFATGSNRLSRGFFGLPAKGQVSIKALVAGARANPACPFAFVKQRPTTWAGLLALPWGIYVGRATVGEFDHMIAYDAWRHMIFLGGDAGDPSAVCRGWFLDDDEVADPAAFERFMLGMIDGLWKNVDGIYRVDVHAKKLLDTSYC